MVFLERCAKLRMKYSRKRWQLPVLETHSVDPESSTLLSYQLSHLIAYDDKKEISVLNCPCHPRQGAGESYRRCTELPPCCLGRQRAPAALLQSWESLPRRQTSPGILKRNVCENKNEFLQYSTLFFSPTVINLENVRLPVYENWPGVAQNRVGLTGTVEDVCLQRSEGGMMKKKGSMCNTCCSIRF